jgi:nucleoside-diphosphate-sugar epimerase
MKKVIVLGGGGFIGGHLAKKLKNQGFFVRVADIKNHEYMAHEDICHEFIQCDLADPRAVEEVIFEDCYELYQLAADMGGAGYIFTGLNDANVMTNSALINLNVAKEAVKKKVQKVFYSSSACMYPEHNQLDPDSPDCREESAYPANPDSEYGWEKLFSERLNFAYHRNYGIPVRVARYHNIFGPEGTWTGGREKAPAAICRKVAELPDVGGTIEVWGDGEQTRSFLYIDECVEATRRMMNSEFIGPVNIGSEEMVTINQLVDTAAKVADKVVEKNHIDGPLGVRGRNSNNDLIREKLGWDYSQTLEEGIRKTYNWIKEQIEAK